jgi:NADP-dependent 3-hydroxy acid dehydrogenase YdfG
MTKTWFITGCSKGFGRHITEELLVNSQDNIVATARDVQTLQTLSTKYPDRLLTLKLDVTNEAEVTQSVSSALTRFGSIDVLINNAGYGIAGTIEDCDMASIKEQYETNVFGLLSVTKAILPFMRKRRSGTIINLSSIAGLAASPVLGIYNSTKFAVEGISEALAQETASFGIKVIIIEPGPFRTDFAGKSIKFIALQNEEYRENPLIKGMIEYFERLHKFNDQKGDPAKAAKIIINLAALEKPPLRLILGNTSVDRARDKFSKLLESIKEYETLSRSADYE